jgi:hypothetical protein
MCVYMEKVYPWAYMCCLPFPWYLIHTLCFWVFEYLSFLNVCAYTHTLAHTNHALCAYTHTRIHTCTHTHDTKECETWLSLAFPLSDLYLNDNNLTLSPGVFSGLPSLRSLVCLRESAGEWVYTWKKFKCEADSPSLLLSACFVFTTTTSRRFQKAYSRTSLRSGRSCAWESVSVIECARLSLAHTSAHICRCFNTSTNTLSHSHAHTLELPCRRVWGLTLSRSLSQLAWSSLQQADAACTRSILGAFFAEVARVFERERNCVFSKQIFVCVECIYIWPKAWLDSVHGCMHLTLTHSHRVSVQVNRCRGQCSTTVVSHIWRLLLLRQHEWWAARPRGLMPHSGWPLRSEQQEYHGGAIERLRRHDFSRQAFA